MDVSDPDHRSAHSTVTNLHGQNRSLFTTNFIRAETYALIGSRLSWSIARHWLTTFNIPMEYVSKDEGRVVEMLLRSDDKTFSYVDAPSFAVMERLGVEEAFTFDRDSAAYGWRVWGLEPGEPAP